MKKIYILWLRQIKRYLRARSRLIGSLAQPLLFLLALGYGFGSTYSAAGKGNYFNFLAPGVMCMGILFTSVFSGIEIIWDKQFGFLKEVLVSPTPRLDIMFGRTLGGATVATIQGIFVMIASIIFGFHMNNWFSIIPALFIMLLISLLFTSIGNIVGSLLNDMQGFQLIMNIFIMPLFFLSGALFPLDNLPKLMTVLTRIDPLSYGVDALRNIFLNSGHYTLIFDLLILLVLNIIFLYLGSYFFKKIEI